MTRNTRLAMGLVAITALSIAIPGAASATAAPQHAPSVQPHTVSARPADIWLRGADGTLVAEHRTGTAAPAAAVPQDALVNMTLRVTLPTDPAPRVVAATMVNTDDARIFSATFEIRHGVQRLSVPEGNYSVLAISDGTDHSTHIHVTRMGFAVDQAITTSGTVINVDLAAANANGFASYSEPTDAETLDQIEFYAVEDSAGRDPAGSWEIFGGPRVRLLVTGTPGGAHGRMISANQTVQRAGGSMYYLASAHRDAVLGDETVPVPAAAMTHIERHYYTDGSTDNASAARTAIYPFFDPGMESFQPVEVPSVRNEYVFAKPDATWLNDVQVSNAAGGFADMSGFAQYEPGTDVREDLWRGPLAPGVEEQPPGARTYPADGRRTCWVCRTPHGMSVGLDPLVGSQPNFGGMLMDLPGERRHETHLTVTRDGHNIIDGFNFGGGVFEHYPARFATPAASHNYRIVATTNRAAERMLLSTYATTEYDFSSSATSEPPLGSSWACGWPGRGPCSALPLLDVQVPLPTSLTGSLPAGYSFVIVNVGHVQGATTSAITGFDLAIRSGSSDWQPQTVESLGGGRYYVAIHNTAAPGTPVSMRWHATDAANSSITQTVQNAYTIAG